MFKFMKSKKGFTLVELMIVVVIMAILVAVAVPIFSAVTKNARTKTCLANQREIQAQLNNAEMSDLITLDVNDKFTLKTTAKGDNGDWEVNTSKSGLKKEDLGKLFQKAPYCPVENNAITVTITENKLTGAEESGYKVVTACTVGTNAADGEVHA